MTVTLESACELHPQVAIRPEPFGALAYHYGNRRLVFLRHPDIVRVVKTMGEHPSLRDTFVAEGVADAVRGAALCRRRLSGLAGRQSVARTGGRRIEAANLLGMGRNTITRKIQELGIGNGNGADEG